MLSQTDRWGRNVRLTEREEEGIKADLVTHWHF